MIFRACIAGLRVDLELRGEAPPGLDRWAPFACGSGPAEITLALEPGSLDDVRGLTGKVEVRGGLWRPGGAEHLGALDPATGRGTARLDPALVAADALVRAALARSVAKRGGVLLHAAALRVDGWCHLVPGASGAGKSTFSRLAGHVITDELPVVFPGTAGAPAQVHGTPWWNARGGEAPLARVYALAWGEPAVTPLAGGLLRHLAQGLVLPLDDAGERARAFAVCAALARSVPFAQVAFRPDTDVDALLRAHPLRRAA